MVDHTSEKLKHVAIGGAIAVAVLVLLGTGIMSSISAEGLDISESSMKKGITTDAVISINVKNIGNSQIHSINGTIFGLPDGVPTPCDANAGTTDIPDCSDEYKFVILARGDPDDLQFLEVSNIISYSEIIPNSKNLSAGTSYPVVVEATNAQGQTISESGILYVSRI